MAAFCLATGYTPSEYRKLTLAEYEAIKEALESRDNGE